MRPGGRRAVDSEPALPFPCGEGWGGGGEIRRLATTLLSVSPPQGGETLYPKSGVTLLMPLGGMRGHSEQSLLRYLPSPTAFYVIYSTVRTCGKKASRGEGVAASSALTRRTPVGLR